MRNQTKPSRPFSDLKQKLTTYIFTVQRDNTFKHDRLFKRRKTYKLITIINMTTFINMSTIKIFGINYLFPNPDKYYLLISFLWGIPDYRLNGKLNPDKTFETPDQSGLTRFDCIYLKN